MLSQKKSGGAGAVVDNRKITEQVEETLRNINNLAFKLQMQSSESSNILNQTTQIVMNEVYSLSQSDSQASIALLEIKPAEGGNNDANNDSNKEQIKNEFIQLH